MSPMNKREIKVPNPFTYGAKQRFLPQLRENFTDYELVLDFEGVDYVDSSALGMLLMARERVGGTKARISLINCNPKIQKILTMAQFHVLFKIS